jgi:hypothetical protein
VYCFYSCQVLTDPWLLPALSCSAFTVNIRTITAAAACTSILGTFVQINIHGYTAALTYAIWYMQMHRNSGIMPRKAFVSSTSVRVTGFGWSLLIAALSSALQHTHSTSSK